MRKRELFKANKDFGESWRTQEAVRGRRLTLVRRTVFALTVLLFLFALAVV